MMKFKVSEIKATLSWELGYLVNFSPTSRYDVSTGRKKYQEVCSAGTGSQGNPVECEDSCVRPWTSRGDWRSRKVGRERLRAYFHGFLKVSFPFGYECRYKAQPWLSPLLSSMSWCCKYYEPCYYFQIMAVIKLAARACSPFVNKAAQVLPFQNSLLVLW